ncbi:hydrogen peroxide-inducible genes activator [Corynebacterium freiburgense]|uniref:hydrogen peroxide-inducible genes activator n=1 Tax=Corynebacterium freiburgense TaxID=556548 RepID=UPI000408CBBD|nr:hydrogen peroxide-inducible genes activator [Corynebacterium freiburgense]WJZ02881.1 putative hydrogen peroxide-inducible genes activator [Corynebacterium freiburgense]
MNNKEYRPTLAQLRTFVTVAENRHFGSAAAKLSISQPSLSQALAALENGLGVQLIERSTRRVIVTPIGESLLPLAKATLDDADAFLAHARGAKGSLTGPLAIGMIPTIAPYILPAFLRLTASELPSLEPRIVENQTRLLLEQLRDGAIDVAVMAIPSNIPGMQEIPTYDENFIVVVPEGHPYAGRKDLTFNALQDLNLLLLDDGHCLRDQVLDLCRTAEISTSSITSNATRASSLPTVIQCVIGGLGATLVPQSAVKTECNRVGLSTASFSPEVSAQRQIGLVFRASSIRSEEFQQLADIVRRAYEASNI